MQFKITALASLRGHGVIAYIGVERRFEVSQGESESNPQRLFPSIISSISYRFVRRLMW